MKKSFTALYGAQQGFHWAMLCPLTAFSAVYLQMKGFDAATVGVVLAVASFAPALLSPIVAARADKSVKLSVKDYLLFITALFVLMLVLLLCFPSGAPVLPLFLIAVVVAKLIEPLLNSVGAYAIRSGIDFDFGVSRSMGSLAFGISSLLLGYAAKLLGADSLIVICLICAGIFGGLIFALPRFEKAGGSESISEAKECSLPEFFVRYKSFTFVMLGFLFIGAFHSMTENFLFNMMESYGGDSSSVGIAVFIANIAEMAAIFFYERFRKKFSSSAWMGISAVLFAIKAFAFYAVRSVEAMYLAQLLQMVTFGLYAPSIVHYATDSVAPGDTVKGQSVGVAMFCLGTSLGNLLGGVLLNRYSVPVMTFTAFILACLGTAIVLTALWSKKKAA